MTENQPKKVNKKKTRGYALVIYLESLPKNFIERINDLHMQCLLSPLHDKDTDPNGQPKKPHYHLMLLFDGPQTEKRAKEVFQEVTGVEVPYVEQLNSIPGMARYLCHLDNPEKYQYPKAEVQEFGGARYLELIEKVADNMEILSHIFDIIEEEDIFSYRKLIQNLKSQPDLFRIATQSNTLAISTYLRARQWDRENDYKSTLKPKEHCPECFSFDIEQYEAKEGEPSKNVCKSCGSVWESKKN